MDNILIEIENLSIAFTDEMIIGFNVIIAFVMFGVALELKVEDFKNLMRSPENIIKGLASQIIVFPLFTLILILILNPAPSIALGMILVCACPGGNVSIFLTQMAKGNSALSIGLTAAMTILVGFLAPLILAVLGNLHEPTKNLLRAIEIDFFQLLLLVLITLGIPLFIGMFINGKNPVAAAKLVKYLKPFSALLFIVFVAYVLGINFKIFVDYAKYVFLFVLLHNALGLISGYYYAKLVGMNEGFRRSLSFELGIPNVGLALLLSLTFFNGLGGMILCVGCWAVWNIISGVALSLYWSKRPISGIKRFTKH